MSYGSNILEIDRKVSAEFSVYVSANQQHSLGAILGQKENLKVVITNTTEESNTNELKATWVCSDSDGWNIENYQLDDTQTFTSIKTGEIKLNISFIGVNPGSCKVEFYENSSTITKTTYLRWGV